MILLLLRRVFHPYSLLAYASFIALVLICIYPKETIHAGLRGVYIWWEVLFPSLFPFFVLSELLLGFGIVHFIGKLLDFLMKPVFRLPGIAGFVLTMGFISGYPVAARLSAKLYEQNHITAKEAERLIGFTTTSDPIFLIGAVSIGFFHSYDLAILFAVVHYGTALLIGITLGIHNRITSPDKHMLIKASTYKPSLFQAAIRAMVEAREGETRSASRLFIDAIFIATKLMIIVGGLVVFFSVILQLLTSTQLLDFIISLLNLILYNIGLPEGFSQAIIPSLFEVTLGAKEASIAPLATIHQAAIAVWALSFAGFSVHAQIASLLSHTPIRYLPFLKIRIVHACIASLILYIVWPLFM